MPRGLILDLIFVALTGLGWGLLAPASKVLFAADPAAFDGTTVAVARAVWTLPMWLAATGVAMRIDPPRLGARGWVTLVAAGLAFGPGITWLFTVAAAHTSVAHIAFLVGVSPVTNAALSAIVFREGLSVRYRIALGLGLLGVSMLAFAKSGGAATWFGDLLMLAWLALFALYAVLLRWVGKRVSTATLVPLVMGIAMIALLPVGILHDGFRGALHVADTPAAGWWFFGEVCLGSTLIAQTAYAAVVRRRGVILATIGAEYIALAVGIAWSLATHEPWSWATIAAGVLLIASLAATFVPVPAAGRENAARA